MLLATVRRNSDRLGALIAKKEAHSHFFTDEFPGLVVEAVRRAEAVRSKERVRRFAAILAHSIELGPKDGPDYVEEMLRIATELSDWDVKVLATASEVFLVHQQRPLITNPLHARMEADSVVAARAWLSMDSGVSRDELASIGAKLQSFGLANRIEGQTGDTSSYLMLERGRRFLEYICAAE